MTGSVMRVAGGLAIACLPALAALTSPSSGALTALTPPLIFAVTLWLWPVSRPEPRPLLSPKNILVLGFAIQLVLAPLAFLVIGPVPWVFPVQQSWRSIATAALLIGLSFPCWVAGVALVEHRLGKRPPPSGSALRVPRSVIVAFVVLGVGGLVLLAWQAGSGTLPDATTLDRGGPVLALRLLLRPFLAMAGVAILSNLMLARSDARVPVAIVGGCLALVVLSHATLDLRRAPLLATCLGLVAAYGLITGRPSARTLVSLGALASVAFILLRVARAPGSFDLLFSSSGTDQSVLEALDTEVQSYAGGMQTVAFMLDHFHVFGGYLGGRGQLSAALSPLPRLGEPFRDSAPSVLYNALFLNRTDQVLPLAGQFYLDFGAVAVALGFTLVGAVTGALHRAFLRSGSIVEAFVWATPAAWLAFSLGSGPAGLYQSLIYFSAPAYVLLALLALRRLRAHFQAVRT